MDRGAWWATVHGVTQSDMMEPPECTWGGFGWVWALLAGVSIWISFRHVTCHLVSMKVASSSWVVPTEPAVRGGRIGPLL